MATVVGETVVNKKRRAGILMPVSSLPSTQGIGTLGKGAYAFVDWLQSAGMRVWQVLPLLPTGYGDSPYQSCASDALNYYFIDFELLEKEGLLLRSEYEEIAWGEDVRRVDYGRLFQYKVTVLEKAFARFDGKNAEWQAFVSKGDYRDFALFMTLKRKFSYAPWQDWPAEYRNPACLPETFLIDSAKGSLFWQFTQFLFLKQWRALLDYAHERGILVMGDMPIYVSEDSVETWKYRDELFMLDEDGRLALRAGVPPDAFSDDGQLWGNPIYDWEKLKEDGYGWWKRRIRYALETQFDIVRIDHFRAFDRFYAIPESAETAKEGEWMDGPKAELFKGFEDAAIVAEDLGVIDDGVRQLLKTTGYPGMKVFEFAFDGNPDNEYLPSNFEGTNSVAYTGTHDNDTLRAFIEGMEKTERREFERVLEDECLALDVPYLTETIEEECGTIIELLLASKADTVIIPMQDILCMGSESRLNAPSTLSSQNWTFRFEEKDFKLRKALWLKELAERYDR